MRTYEEVLMDIAAIPSGVAGYDRDIHWLTQANVVGVARDPLGRLEAAHWERFLAAWPVSAPDENK